MLEVIKEDMERFLREAEGVLLNAEGRESRIPSRSLLSKGGGNSEERKEMQGANLFSLKQSEV